MQKVVIIDGELASGKQSPYEHPAVLAKKAEVQREINSTVLPKGTPKAPKSYQEKQELKAHKRSYKKLDELSKQTLLADILNREIPNMNVVVVIPK